MQVQQLQYMGGVGAAVGASRCTSDEFLVVMSAGVRAQTTAGNDH